MTEQATNDRTAVQSLIAVIAGAMDPEQKTTPTKPQPTIQSTGSGVAFQRALGPQSLSVYLNWEKVIVHRGDESVTIDQDELFQALKRAPQEQD